MGSIKNSVKTFRIHKRFIAFNLFFKYFTAFEIKIQNKRDFTHVLINKNAFLLAFKRIFPSRLDFYWIPLVKPVRYHVIFCESLRYVMFDLTKNILTYSFEFLKIFLTSKYSFFRRFHAVFTH